MCEICSSDCFTECVDCGKHNAFNSCHPDYVACSNPEKGPTCTELSAYKAAAALALASDSHISCYSVDCARCGYYCDCTNPPFYSCTPQGWVDDFYDEENCCETCDNKLAQLRWAQERHDNIAELETLHRQLPTLKAELATLEAELPKTMSDRLKEIDTLTKTMRDLAFKAFTLSIVEPNPAKIDAVYTMAPITRSLAEITTQLAKCRTVLHSPEHSVKTLQERVQTMEKEICRLTRRTAQNPTA
jgi:hypothetical protein